MEWFFADPTDKKSKSNLYHILVNFQYGTPFFAPYTIFFAEGVSWLANGFCLSVSKSSCRGQYNQSIQRNQILFLCPLGIDKENMTFY